MSTANAPWTQLLSLTTLGLRASSIPDTLWPEGLSPLPGPSPSDTVLRAAMARYLTQTAGERAQAGPVPEVSSPPPPARRLVCEAAAWRLGQMLPNHALLPEWLLLAEREQREVPIHWLPMVLEQLPLAQQLRHPQVLGPAAAWLAALNPQWQRSATEPSEEIWNSGSLQERCAEFTRLREKDPPRAREWLEQSWPTETPEGRAKLFPLLRAHLSAADEPFLERALDDSRKEVRTVAIECLRQLPESAYALRNQARLTALITGEIKKRSLTLQIELPTQVDRAAQRDGIVVRRPVGVKMGDRAYWLSQLVALTPPRYWSERFQCEPEVFLDALAKTDHGEGLQSSLIEAVARHPDPKWSRALCLRLLEGTRDSLWERANQIAQLVSSLPPEQEQSLAVELLSRPLDLTILDRLLDHGRTWSPKGTVLAITALKSTRQANNRNWVSGGGLQSFAHRADVDAALPVLEAALADLAADSPQRGFLEQLHPIFHERALMRQELQTDG